MSDGATRPAVSLSARSQKPQNTQKSMTTPGRMKEARRLSPKKRRLAEAASTRKG